MYEILCKTRIEFRVFITKFRKKKNGVSHRGASYLAIGKESSEARKLVSVKVLIKFRQGDVPLFLYFWWTFPNISQILT